MKKIALIIFLSIFATAKTITFSEALDLTILNNKELKAKEFDSKKAIETLKEAKGHNLGKLEFVENISRTNNSGHIFGMKLASREATFGDFGFSQFDNTNPDILNVQPDDLNNPDARTNFETKITYDIPLYVGGKLQSAQSMASLQVRANMAKFSHDKKQLGLAVFKAYNGAVAAKRFIAMTKKAKKITNRFVKVSRGLYRNRLARIIDVKQSKIADKSIDIKLQEAQKKFELAIAYLRFLTSDDKITDVGSFALIRIGNMHLETLQKTAIENRDDYKWMELNADTMKKKIDFDSSNNYPMIGAHLEYGMNDNSIDLGEAHNKDYYLAAIGLRYSLLDGGVTNIKKQKLTTSKQKATLSI
jgi:outer membrane protein TolC